MCEQRPITHEQTELIGSELPPAPAALSEEAMREIVAKVWRCKSDDLIITDSPYDAGGRAAIRALSGHVANQTAEIERLNAALDFEKSNHAEWVKRVDEDHAKLKAEVERLRAEVENRRDSGKAALKAQVEVKCLRYELAEAKKRIERQIAHIDGQNRIIQIRNQRIRELEETSEPPQTQECGHPATSPVESQDAGAAPDSNGYRCAAEWRDKYQSAAERIADLERQLDAVTKERDDAIEVVEKLRVDLDEANEYGHQADIALLHSRRGPTLVPLDYEAVKAWWDQDCKEHGIEAKRIFWSDDTRERFKRLCRHFGAAKREQLLAALNVVRYGISGKDNQAIDDAYNRLRAAIEAMEVK